MAGGVQVVDSLKERSARQLLKKSKLTEGQKAARKERREKAKAARVRTACLSAFAS